MFPLPSTKTKLLDSSVPEVFAYRATAVTVDGFGPTSPDPVAPCGPCGPGVPLPHATSPALILKTEPSTPDGNAAHTAPFPRIIEPLAGFPTAVSA
jgi:hypothetical protein